MLAGEGRLIVAGGGDAARLEAALEARAAEARIILSCGIAGALDPGLKAGDVVIDLNDKPLPFRSSGAVPSPGRDQGRQNWVGGGGDPSSDAFGEGLRKALSDARCGAIIGQDHIAASPAEKAALYAQTGALAVDMETHIAARVAARHSLPFAAIRVISDTAHEALPPAALVGMNPDGTMALGRVLGSLARHPTQLPALIRTGRNAETAFRALRRVGDALVGLGVGDADFGQFALDMR